MSTARIPLAGLSTTELKELMVKLGAPAYRGKQLATWIYKKVVSDFDEMPDLPLELREQLKKGGIQGPRLIVVGPAFTSIGGHPAVSICKGNEWCRKQLCVEVDDVSSAIKIVQSLAEKNVDAIKIVNDGGKPGFSCRMARSRGKSV